MKRARLWLHGLSVSVCLGASWGAFAGGPDSCETEASWVPSATVRHLLVLGASNGVLYNHAGAAFVMLMKTDAASGESEMGAVGVHADEKGRAVFGAVPWQAYDAFLHEHAGESKSVMVRLELNEPQYLRILRVLRGWERRAREDTLLYPGDVFMNNVLLVKQATEEINRCGDAVKLYKLDWGVNDRISDDRAPARIPYLVFEELKRLNSSLHVPDSEMPDGLASLAGSTPLPARKPAPEENAVTHPPAHSHHHTHEHADAAQ